jgi:hypothetical protein
MTILKDLGVKSVPAGTFKCTKLYVQRKKEGKGEASSRTAQTFSRALQLQPLRVTDEAHVGRNLERNRDKPGENLLVDVGGT